MRLARFALSQYFAADVDIKQHLYQTVELPWFCTIRIMCLMVSRSRQATGWQLAWGTYYELAMLLKLILLAKKYATLLFRR